MKNKETALCSTSQVIFFSSQCALPLVKLDRHNWQMGCSTDLDLQSDIYKYYSTERHTSKLSLLAEQIQVWKFEFRHVTQNSFGLVYRMQDGSRAKFYKPSKGNTCPAELLPQRLPPMCSSLWKCWRLRKKNGPRSKLEVVTLPINKPTWIQDYLLHMLAQTADSLTIRKVDLKLYARNLDGFSMVSTPVKRIWWFAPSRGMVVQARGQHASAWAGGEGDFLMFQRFKSLRVTGHPWFDTWPQLLVFVKSIQSAEEPLHPALKCHARRAFQSGGAKLKIANNNTRLQHGCKLLKRYRKTGQAEIQRKKSQDSVNMKTKIFQQSYSSMPAQRWVYLL